MNDSAREPDRGGAYRTHEVFNQPTPLAEAVTREGAGSAAWQELAALAVADGLLVRFAPAADSSGGQENAASR